MSFVRVHGDAGSPLYELARRGMAIGALFLYR